MKNILVLLIVLSTAGFAFAEKADSVGTRVKNGKLYVLHKVEQGQGLYSISKKYNVSMLDIVEENPGADKVIKVDQVIWVPIRNMVNQAEPAVEEFFDKKTVVSADETTLKTDREASTFAKYHTVLPGETLYAISKQHNTTVDAIKALNELQDNQISEGMKLLVPGNKNVLLEEPEQDQVGNELEEIRKRLNMEDKTIKDTNVSEFNSQGDYSIKITKLPEYNLEKIEEKGFVGIGSDEIPADKNFAYHYNAPKGTVIMVTNPMNNKTVFVKVIGNFIKEEDSAVILKLSPLSAESIGLQPEESNQGINLSYAR